MESTEWTQQLLDAELYLQASTSLPSLGSFQLPNKAETSLKQKAEDVTCADEDQQLLKEVYANLSLDQKLFKQEEEELHAQRVPDFCRKLEALKQVQRQLETGMPVSEDTRLTSVQGLVHSMSEEMQHLQQQVSQLLESPSTSLNLKQPSTDSLKMKHDFSPKPSDFIENAQLERWLVKAEQRILNTVLRELSQRGVLDAPQKMMTSERGKTRRQSVPVVRREDPKMQSTRPAFQLHGQAMKPILRRPPSASLRRVSEAVQPSYLRPTASSEKKKVPFHI